MLILRSLSRRIQEVWNQKLMHLLFEIQIFLKKILGKVEVKLTKNRKCPRKLDEKQDIDRYIRKGDTNESSFSRITNNQKSREKHKGKKSKRKNVPPPKSEYQPLVYIVCSRRR